MFLFSWFGTLQPRFYICLRVVRFASFLRQTLATLRCQPIVLVSWCMGRWTWLLRLQIKKWSSCKGNGVVACEPLQLLLPNTTAASKKISVDRRENGVVALRFSAIFKKDGVREPKKESAEAPSSLSWSWKLYIICKGITTSYLLLCF